MHTSSQPEPLLETTEFFCPAWVSALPHLSRIDFEEQLLEASDPELYLEETRVDDPMPYLRALQDAMGGLRELPVEETLSPWMERAAQSVKRIEIGLEAQAGRIWLRVLCTTEAGPDNVDLPLLKAYIAERIDCNQELIFQFATAVHDDGMAAITFEPICHPTPSCRSTQDKEIYKDNHLLSRDELQEAMDAPLRGHTMGMG